jgi:dienelactone hydrolase
VVYSHGNAADPFEADYLLEHLVTHGFIVAAPWHTGATSVDCPSGCTPEQTVASAAQRPDDVEFVLRSMTALPGGDPLAGAIDPDRAAIAGLSFGGWTGVKVAHKGSFDALLALAAGPPEGLYGDAEQTDVPVLHFAAENDEFVPVDGIVALVAAYPRESGARMVLVRDAFHSNFTDRCFGAGCRSLLPQERGHEIVRAYAAAFLLAHVAGKEAYLPYLDEAIAGASVHRAGDEAD